MADKSDTSGNGSPRASGRSLPGISRGPGSTPRTSGALVALRKLKGFDTLLKAMSGLVNERAVRLVFLGSAVRVDERQFARLHRPARRGRPGPRRRRSARSSTSRPTRC